MLKVTLSETYTFVLPLNILIASCLDTFFEYIIWPPVYVFSTFSLVAAKLLNWKHSSKLLKYGEGAESIYAWLV